MKGIRGTLATVMFAGLVTLPLAGCAQNVRLSSQKMCEAAGGTYSSTVCNPGAPNQRTAAQMCRVHGGEYLADLDTCEVKP
jgi:hypothetical protein